jgi:hypothetical protein
MERSRIKQARVEAQPEKNVDSVVVIAPPFTRETAMRKVRAAEESWNSRDP